MTAPVSPGLVAARSSCPRSSCADPARSLLLLRPEWIGTAPKPGVQQAPVTTLFWLARPRSTPRPCRPPGAAGLDQLLSSAPQRQVPHWPRRGEPTKDPNRDDYAKPDR